MCVPGRGGPFGGRLRHPGARSLGERLRLLACDPSCYAHELERLPADPLDVVVIDTFDTEAVHAELGRTPALNGLIGSTDTRMPVGAELTARFGLPGLGPAVPRRYVEADARADGMSGRAGLRRTPFCLSLKGS
ncbi:hypothetical protein [Streptomyces sp. SP18CS02]|uniref:hypothetical protein n=1 Tax=Streptomyces sp. SP18CS02 TaxID=3002531 RepID=UPI002E7660A2|nr:hypothetical protein [Streptomyces sp. SP18CS02]MEE1751913.1 hypothetical protein [Streptomyces sp. SP18CS02]